MSLKLPNLDDRRWTDLVDEGRSLIPFYAPRWTNYNLADPGITLIDLLAWVVEMDVYQFNRVPPAHVRKFLKLIGAEPHPPRAARAVISLGLQPGAAAVHVPAGCEFLGIGSSQLPIPFRTLNEVWVQPISLTALLVDDGKRITDFTRRLRHSQPIEPFGTNPAPGAALYLGLSTAPIVNKPLSIHVTFANQRAARQERTGIGDEELARQQSCRPLGRGACCPEHAESSIQTDVILPAHQSARITWEYFDGSHWVEFAGSALQDDTRSLTLSGSVQITPTAPPRSTRVGPSVIGCFIRCRFDSGAFEEPPRVLDVTVNGVTVEQAVPQTATFALASGIIITGGIPAAGASVNIDFDLDPNEQITRVDFTAGNGPAFRLLSFVQPHGSKPGAMVLEGQYLGIGTGRPLVKLALSQQVNRVATTGATQFTDPVEVPLSCERTPQLHTLEASAAGKKQWTSWALTSDLDATAKGDAIAAWDATAGEISFGDAQNARVVPEGSFIFLTGLCTWSAEGNVMADGIMALADSPHNHAMPGWSQIAAALDPRKTTHRFATDPGAAGQSLADAAQEAAMLREKTQRAVTLDDIQTLATTAPGTAVARAWAKPQKHPAFACAAAPGNITIVVIPYLPEGRPTPSAGLLRTVSRWLSRRRVIGTALSVVGPTYVEIVVSAVVAPMRGVVALDVQAAIVRALSAFFDPINGGATGEGWPLGYDVYRAQVMQVIVQVPGVDHIVSMELVAGGQATCGNVCVGALGLVASGAHEIQVQIPDPCQAVTLVSKGSS